MTGLRDGSDVAPAAIERLRGWGGDALVRELSAIFFEDAPGRLAAARAAADAGDATAVARAAHGLKSSAGQLGAAAVQRLCERVESHARAGALDGLPALLDDIDSALEQFRGWLAAVVGASGVSGAAEAPRPRTVAVVDDTADNRLLLRAILGDRCEIIEYESGPDALLGLARAGADVVLLDISLPGMDGVEVLRCLRADARLRALPVIALTAYAMAGDRERYLAAGFDGYIAKPIVDESELFDAIERVLGEAS